MINVALPKGRLGDKVYKLLAGAGYGCRGMEEESRKLIFEDEDTGVRYFRVKPSDVAVYVEYGAADIGIAGLDILLENKPDVYELLDLGIGRCRMAVAAVKGYRENTLRPLRVATKFTSVARAYYEKKNRETEIIKLYGSIELAPITGLSDVIVDLVETGATLKENNLEVIEEITDISARLIANRQSYVFKTEEIRRITEKLREAAK